MSAIENWIEKLKKAEKTCLVQDGKKKIHFTFEDKTEMAEEYNAANGELLVRKWRRKNTLGATLPWEFEVGQNVIAKPIESLDMTESNANPICVRQDTAYAFQWRIRNMTYPADNYQVEVDEKQNQIIVKTINKKYYKKINIADLDRIRIGLQSCNLKFSHSNNTLIISYQKPKEFVAMEKQIVNELSKTKATVDGDANECKPS